MRFIPIWAAAQPRLLFLLAKEEKEAKRRMAKGANNTANSIEKAAWLGHFFFRRHRRGGACPSRLASPERGGCRHGRQEGFFLPPLKGEDGIAPYPLPLLPVAFFRLSTFTAWGKSLANPAMEVTAARSSWQSISLS